MTHGTGTLCAQSHATELRHSTRELKQIVKDAWQQYWARRAQRTSAFILGSLDDRTLADIGITRSEIQSVVRDTSGQRLRTYDPKWE